MKKLYLLLLLLIGVARLSAVHAQTFACPNNSSSNNDYGSASFFTDPTTDCRITVNVFVHLVGRSDGSGRPADSVAGQIVDKLNSTYNPWKISFYSTGYDHIDNNQYGNAGAVTIGNFNNLLSVNSQSNAVDVYLLPTGATTFGGVAQNITGKGLILDGSLIFTNGAIADVVSHEMGHCFNLFHTFHGTAEPGSCAELVNGSNSSTCGDFISDTPADPVNQVGFCQSNCNFNPSPGQCSTQDANGQAYAPNMHNIMSYGLPACLNMFTSRQANRMRAALRNASILAPVIRSITADVTGTYTHGGPSYTAAPGSNGITLSSSNPTGYITFTTSQPGTTFSWQVTSQSSTGTSFATNNGGRGATITCNPGKQLSATCTITTTCGTISYSFNCYNVSGGFRMAAYPNPANQDLTVAAIRSDDQKEDKFQDEGMAADRPIQDNDVVDVDASIRLLDKNNTILREGGLQKGKLNFPVSKLPNGIYYLQMTFGDKLIRKQIVIQH